MVRPNDRLARISSLNVTAGILAAALGMSCTTIDCPPGTVGQSGNCVEMSALTDGDAGGTSSLEGGAAAADGGDNGAKSGAGSPSENGASPGGMSGGGSGAAGAGAAAGSSGAGASGAAGVGAAGSADEPCMEAAAQRCSTSGAGTREMCSNGVWTVAPPCASNETCVDDAGATQCVLVAELCRGNGEQTVCDTQGTLIVCNADESIGSMMACESAMHCQVGSAAGTCAICIPKEEHRCTGTALEQCADDGMSFVSSMTCQTEALCNPMLGKCTEAVCEPETKSCDGNNLVTCNESGTAVASMERCATGMCDGAGGDCNQCAPGAKKCEGDMVMTCDATGQTYEPMPCPNGDKCVGVGQCVECSENGDCGDLTQGCKVGVCMRNACMAGNAPNRTECTASGSKPGRCSSGTCVCEPQCGGKECGDNGCNGSCGSCTGGTKCSNTFECVECTATSDCRSSNPCQRGTCSGGSCSFAPVNGGRCEGTGTCRNGTCCQGSCEGKCGGDDDGCGGTCPDRCSGKTCDKGQCLTCPPGKTGCGYSTPECWDCTRTIRQGGASTAISVFKCDTNGTSFSIVNYCGVSDCTDAVETATCLGNDTEGSCSFTGGTAPNGVCPP